MGEGGRLVSFVDFALSNTENIICYEEEELKRRRRRRRRRRRKRLLLLLTNATLFSLIQNNLRACVRFHRSTIKRVMSASLSRCHIMTTGFFTF